MMASFWDNNNKTKGLSDSTTELTTLIKNLKIQEEGQLLAKEELVEILIAEDNLAQQRILKKYIENFDSKIVITIAKDGEEALSCSQQKKFTLIFSDNQMPKMTGIQLIGKIRQNSNPNFATPIIGNSNDSGTETPEKMKQAGATEFIHKESLMREKVQELLKTYIFANLTLPESATSKESLKP